MKKRQPPKKESQRPDKRHSNPTAELFPELEPAAGAWADLEWLRCSDGKARPTQPGLFPLAHGIPNRVGRLRAYGNAIVPQVAAAFVAASLTHNAEITGG